MRSRLFAVLAAVFLLFSGTIAVAPAASATTQWRCHKTVNYQVQYRYTTSPAMVSIWGVAGWRCAVAWTW